MEAQEGLEPAAVGKHQVEQDQVEALPLQQRFTFLKGDCAPELDLRGSFFQQCADQLRLDRIASMRRMVIGLWLT